MLIDLDRDLAAAARDDHDPSRVDGTHLAAALARQGHHRNLRWLAVAVALALVVGLVAWYRPRLGPVPQPAPTPTPAWSWNLAHDPELSPLPEELAAQRCPARAGEVLVAERSQQAAGGWLTFAPAGWDHRDEKALRTCDLGYQHPADPSPATAAELAGDADALRLACERHTGLHLDPRTWRVVASTGFHDWGGSWAGPRRTVGLVSDDGWQATCRLTGASTSRTPSAVSVERVRELTAATCPAIEVFVDRGEWRARGTARVTHLVLDGFWVVPSAQHRPDTSVARLTVTLGAPFGRTLGPFEVEHGFVVAGTTTRFSPPVTWTTTSVVPLTVTLADASGRTLRTCTP